MLVGKDIKNIVIYELFVDSWSIDYQENTETGEDDRIETFNGQVAKRETQKHKNLGFVISSKGDNMANIRQIEKKSIGVKRKIMNRLNSLHLQKYYF